MENRPLTKIQDTGGKMEESTIVKVRWKDTSHFDDLTVDELVKEPVSIFTSLGFLILDSTEKVIVAASRCEVDNNYRGALVIPRECIVDIKIQEVADDS